MGCQVEGLEVGRDRGRPRNPPEVHSRERTRERRLSETDNGSWGGTSALTETLSVGVPRRVTTSTNNRQTGVLGSRSSRLCLT